MDLLVLGRHLRDEAIRWAEHETGQKPDLQDLTLIGGSRPNVEAFAVAFRITPFDAHRGQREYTVTISETNRL